MLSHSLLIPGPFAAANASSPMKKSKSSVPLFADKAPPEPAPPVRNEGLFAMAGLPDPEPPAPPGPPFVAIAVGKTKEGESLPAKPSRHQDRAKIVPLSYFEELTKLREACTTNLTSVH